MAGAAAVHFRISSQGMGVMDNMISNRARLLEYLLELRVVVVRLLCLYCMRALFPPLLERTSARI